MSEKEPKTRMRELHRIGDVSLSIYDDDNFCVGKISVALSGKLKGHETRHHMSYHSNMANALSNMAGRIAKSEANTLAEYANTFERVGKELVAALRGA